MKKARHWLRVRGRDVTFHAAIVATALLVTVAVVEITNRWRDERVAMRRALDGELADAAGMLLDQLGAQRTTTSLVLMAPVHGMQRGAGDAALPLASFERYTAAHLEGMGFTGDPAHGVFRIDMRAPWPTPARLESSGALRDSALARSVLTYVDRRERRARPDAPPIRSGRVHHAGRTLDVLYTTERRDDGSAIAIVGLTFDATFWQRRIVDQALASVPLLPPSFYGVDWSTARPMQRDAASGRTQVALNGLLDISLVARDGVTLLQRGPNADTTFVGTVEHDGLTVRVALPRDRAERLVEAAVPVGAEQWLLAGVALLGALCVAVAIVELRRQRQLAEERRNFVSAVSHELRTPLAHVALLSETLLGPATPNVEQQRRWLAVIHREALRLGRLVENVLLHTRGEQHDLTLDRRAVDVADIAREVEVSLGPVAMARETRLVVSAPDRCVAEVDGGAVRQILLNLTDNAVKHGPDGQTVHVAVAKDLDARWLVLTVEDQGHGIPARDRRRVWRPFVRLGDRGGATGGSGLGLSVVRDLVALHGGAVEIADAAGGGARFVVTLPVGV